MYTYIYIYIYIYIYVYIYRHTFIHLLDFCNKIQTANTVFWQDLKSSSMPYILSSICLISHISHI